MGAREPILTETLSMFDKSSKIMAGGYDCGKPAV